MVERMRAQLNECVRVALLTGRASSRPARRASGSSALRTIEPPSGSRNPIRETPSSPRCVTWSVRHALAPTAPRGTRRGRPRAAHARHRSRNRFTVITSALSTQPSSRRACPPLLPRRGTSAGRRHEAEVGETEASVGDGRATELETRGLLADTHGSRRRVGGHVAVLAKPRHRARVELGLRVVADGEVGRVLREVRARGG